MAALGLDCLFLTGEKNIRYLTGFHTQIWVSPTRPCYVILPLEEKPVAIAPVTNVPGFRQTSWIADDRSWPAPRPADDGVSLVVDAVRACVRPGGRVGCELGPETRLEMPAGDFLRIRDVLAGLRLEDASRVLRPLRMVKSDHEVARLRTIAGLASEAFARLPARLRPGQTEPSLAAGDDTVLEVGMALTIEPSFVWPAPGGGGRRLMVHEENIVVTADGCELLTRRAVAELPVVG